MEEKVSVIMPAYNASKFIEKSIESVRSQTYSNWELLIADDGSSDHSVDIIKRFSNKDQRIKLVEIKNNNGAANARNEAIKKSNGRYLAFLDSDDLWAPEKLKKQVEFMKVREIGFSFTNYRMISEDGHEMDRFVICPEKVTYEDLLKNTIIGCLTVIIDKNKISDVAFPNVKPEDTALWLSILRQGHAAYCLQEDLAMYRVVKGSVSSNRLKAAMKFWMVLRKGENLNFLHASRCFTNYSFSAVLKHYGK